MSKFNELVTKLREVFQIDRPELDFGVYRILNARADEINEYLEKRLKEKVEQALASGNAANIDQLNDDLKKAEQAASDAGFDPAESPKVKELKAKITQASSGSAEHENAVFSHLLTFFSRYYDNGDFISQRRYKGDTYAIPYAGEEVMLHWANKDQYYIKSGENFSNYSFKLQDGRVVHFRLIAADTAKDNRKDNDKERRFVLAEQKIITRIDDEGDEYEEEILPVEEVIKKDSDGHESKELIIRFEYKAMPKGSKQDKLVEAAVNAVLADGTVASRWLDLSKREPTEKNPKRTLLEKQLSNYTTKNTADYFIHKNLGKFLRGELDFYIKNEVMHLDNVQNAEAFSDIEKNLRMIQCLRSIALDLIKFLAQLEDFQKRLWTKKKFVVDTNYCVTLDLAPEDLYTQILSNEAQWSEWRALKLWSSEGNGDIRDLQKNKYFPIDTRNFSSDFKNSLIRHLEDIDKTVSGVIIGADNYHGLRAIKERYQEKVDLIHIDPPYNTFSSGFLYKNSFQHSSWLSLMESRLLESKSMLANKYCYQAHIDENEYERLFNLFEDHNLGYLSSVIWNKKNPMMGGKGLAIQHEYIIFGSNDDEPFPMKNDNVLEIIEYKETLIKKYGAVTEQCREDFSKWVKSNKKLSGGEKANCFLEDDGRIYQSVGMSWPNPKPAPEQFFVPLIHPETGQNCPVPPRGWSRSPDKMKELAENNEIIFGRDHSIQPRRKIYLTAESKKPLPSIVSNGAKGKVEVDHMGLEFSYCHPTSLYQDILYAGLRGNNRGVILDYFAGSGTTGHATMALNKFDEGSRKYILIEQGQHVDSVLLPRLKKAIYSLEWKNGEPVKLESGSSQCLKIIKLESYEDALNNLELKRPKADLFDNNPDLKDDYLLNYMLDVESRGSLLSTDDFKKPFDYTMKIAVDSAGAFAEQKVDLVETFNYLIGLTVKHIDAQPERGFVSVTGTLPSNETCLVLWRDCEKIDYEGLNKLCDKLALNPADNEFDVVYINGDHNIPTVLTQTAEEGGETRVLKLRQIEPEFLERMFAEEDV